MPAIWAGIGCLERIQIYLDTEERSDFRTIPGDARKVPSDGPSYENVDHVPEKGEEEALDVVSISGASFSWNQTSRPVLKNVNLSIHRGEHVAVIGQVGSGKSLLLNAILGEAIQSEGSTAVSTPEISYCAQTPWLENLNGMKTVSRNAEGDVAWLQSVIWACGLEDVEGLKEYADGSIGTGGASLSGGQKQRLVSWTSTFIPS